MDKDKVWMDIFHGKIQGVHLSFTLVISDNYAGVILV